MGKVRRLVYFLFFLFFALLSATGLLVSRGEREGGGREGERARERERERRPLGDVADTRERERGREGAQAYAAASQ